MVYIVWLLVGLGVAAVVGTGLRRHTMQPSWLAGGAGGLIGGILSDGVPYSQAANLNVLSIIGALVGALVVVWIARERDPQTGR